MQEFMIANIGQTMQNAKLNQLMKRIYAIDDSQLLLDNIMACHQSLKNPENFARNTDTFAMLNATAIAARFHSFVTMFTNIELQAAAAPTQFFEQLKTALVEQLPAQCPAFMRKFILRFAEVSIKQIIDELKAKLITLAEAQDVSKFTAKTALYSLKKIILLAQCLEIADPSQRTLVLNTFATTNQAESHGLLSILLDNRFNFTEYSTTHSELCSMIAAIQNYPTSESPINLAKVILLNIPLHHSLTSISMYYQAMCTELASEFYGHVLFDYIPTAEEFAQFFDTLPNLIRISTKGTIQQACGSAMQQVQDGFCKILFSVIRDPTLQRTCIESLSEAVLAATPQIFEEFWDYMFIPYCEQHPLVPETRILEEIHAAFQAKLEAMQITQIQINSDDEIGDIAIDVDNMVQQLARVEDKADDKDQPRSPRSH
ncbi:MAG: hypothetical protein M3R00_04605 [Pseudomonadota bacterium]|nr:hypothetical protein [Pseudomonadota bacterium]